MIIFPAIDLFDKKAVRLYKGNYDEMTVYSENPIEIAKDFEQKGATHIHMVDLEGAKDGNTPNIELVKQVVDETKLFVEVGGGIRSMDTIKRYFLVGVDRVILGTAAITDEALLKQAVAEFGDKIAVGADVKDGFIAIKGWVLKSEVSLDEFMLKMQKLGVKNVICTDISRDGAMRGTNLELYRDLSLKYNLDITASGGVSTLDDIRRLREMDLYGAIIGKAYYTKAIDLEQALEEAK